MLFAARRRVAFTKCGKTYPRAQNGAPVLMTALDRAQFTVLLEREEGAQMQASYVRRRERNWIRKFFPPEPVYVNPQAPLCRFRGLAHVFGSAARDWTCPA